MAAIIEDQPGPNGAEPEIDIIEGRKWLRDFEKEGVDGLPPLSSNLEEFYTDIPTSDGWQSKCKVVRPKMSTHENDKDDEPDKTKRHPLIVYFYGGGFGMGSPEQVTRPAREWAEEHNATVVCPTYHSTPEHRWPRSVKDGWDVISYLAQHAETDPRFGNVRLSDGFVLGGASAGGNVAGVVGGIALLTQSNDDYKLVPAVEKLAAPITGLHLAVPLLAHEDMIPPAYKHLFTAWEDNSHDPNMNTANIMRTFTLLQCTDYRSPWFSPINVLERALLDNTTADSKDSSSSLRTVIKRNHPSVYLQACARDPVRDDPIVYQNLMKDLGLQSRSRLDLFPDDGHTAWTVLPFKNNSKNPTMKEGVLEGMRWLLRDQSDGMVG